MAYVDYSAAFAYKDLLTYQKLNQLGANDVYLKALTDNVNQDVKTSASPTFAGLTLENSGLHVLDTNASHDLVITPGSDLSADRILTITTGDAARTLTLSGNATLNDWFDQSVKQAASPQFAGLTDTGDSYLNGYAQIGTSGPRIKMVRYTGTTGSSEGQTVDVVHGAIVGVKIIAIFCSVNYATNACIQPEYTGATGYQFHLSWSDGNIHVVNHVTNSENILSKGFVITVIYEA